MDVPHRGGAGAADVVAVLVLSHRPPAGGALADAGGAAMAAAAARRRARDARAARRGAPGCMSMLDPRVIALGFVYMGCNIPQYGLSFFLPQIVKALRRLSNVEVGLITALPYVVGAIGMMLVEPPFRRDRRAQVAHRHSARDHRGRPRARRGGADAADQDGLPVHRRIRILLGAAGVLDAADHFPHRDRRGGRHRRGQFDRQSRRLFRPARCSAR